MQSEKIRAVVKVAPVAALLLLAFAFLDARAIWDSDEGRYTAVALNMLMRHDWLVPHKSFEFAHWTKPPLLYWSLAVSFATLGTKVWVARLTPAFAYLISAVLVGLIARRLAPGHARLAALIFASMVLPAGASQIVSIDMLLTACEALAMFGYVEYRWGDGRRQWLALMFAGFALAVLAKGPPGVLPVLAIIATGLLAPDGKRVFSLSGAAVFLAIAAPWFVIAAARVPGLMHYWMGHEVIGRVTTDEFGRNGQWYGWIKVYGPTLLIGSLPWTGFCFREIHSDLRRCMNQSAGRPDAQRSQRIFLLAWLLLPLLVFCASRSRLPLYLLPLTLPLALFAVRGLAARSLANRLSGPLLVWIVVLLAARPASGLLHSEHDPLPLVRAIQALSDGPVSEVVFVETAPRYSLRLYLDLDVEAVNLGNNANPRISRKFDETLEAELSTPTARQAVWIATQSQCPLISAEIERRGHSIRIAGRPVNGMQLFRIDR